MLTLDEIKLFQNIRRKTREKTREKNAQKTTQKIESLLIELLIANPESSRTKLAQDLGDITTDGVKYHLNKLKKQGKIERIGPDKGGYWKVNKKP
jgi:ATP-dependent DNA helicase RecG